MRLDRVMDGFWLARRRELSQATQADYGITFRRLVELLGPECVFEGITAEDVQRLLNGLAEQGLGPKSLLNAHTGLSALCLSITGLGVDKGRERFYNGAVKTGP